MSEPCIVCKKTLSKIEVFLVDKSSGIGYVAHRDCLPQRSGQTKLATFAVAHGDGKSLATTSQSIV